MPHRPNIACISVKLVLTLYVSEKQRLPPAVYPNLWAHSPQKGDCCPCLQVYSQAPPTHMHAKACNLNCMPSSPVVWKHLHCAVQHAGCRPWALSRPLLLQGWAGTVVPPASSCSTTLCLTIHAVLRTTSPPPLLPLLA